MSQSWSAKGLVFENCNCQIVCPGHVHFDQDCTHERCIGWWAFRFDEGLLGDIDLAGLRAIIAYDSPRHMIDGGWTQVIIVGEGASEAQVQAVSAILDGSAGGPWEILGRFVGTALPTRVLAIDFEEEETMKRVVVQGLLDGRIEHIRGQDKSQPVTFQNMYNQIHDTTMVIARGQTTMDIEGISVQTEGTHGLYSNFDWAVTGE